MMRPRKMCFTFVMVGGVLWTRFALSADPTAGMIADLDLDVLTIDPVRPAAEAPAETPAPVAPAEPVEQEPEAPPAPEVNPDAAVEAAAAVVTEPAVVDTPAVTDPNAALISEMRALESLRRKALEQHGFASLERAKTAFRKGRFSESKGLYEEAVKFIDDRPANDLLLAEAERGIAESIYRESLLTERQGDRESAVQMMRVAREKGHPKAVKEVKRMEYVLENPVIPKPGRTPQRWNEQEYKDQREASTKLLSRAREYMATGEYDQARSALEEILASDPYHTEAIEMLRRVHLRRYDIKAREVVTTHNGMITDVAKAWIPRDYNVDKNDQWGGYKPAQNGGTSQGGGAGNKGTDSTAIIDKMKAITIPECSFQGANIYDVIGFLRDQSRELDGEDVPVQERGVNLILNLNAGKSSASPEPASTGPADPFTDPDAGTGGGDVGIPSITFSARYITLFDALKIVMDMANLKYRIKGKVVMIIPADAPDSEIMHRWYNVLPTVLERVTRLREEIGRGRGRGGDDVFRIDSSELGDRGNWREFFEEMGVNWPAGSSISHMESIGKLVVANTAENLTTLETILSVLNVTPSQIEIEARFVEVLQSDLESLGIEWLLTDDWELASHEGDANLPPEARRRVEVPSNVANDGFTTGLRYLTGGVLGSFGGDAVTDNILQVASVLTNPEMTMVLHALSRKQDTDLLSAPKVVTKSGLEATIKVVTEYIYPTEFTVEGLTSETGNQNTTTTGAVVEPGGFETREVGVVLTCIPEVSPEGEIINLTLNPQVVSEPEWRNYGSEYISGYTDDGQPLIQRLNMEQPFFPVRSVNTSISIYNGATVVMGGMITEARVAVDDKIPFLGDIPVVGRLFRSRYETSVKRNLLIFVTARMVDPAGRALTRNADTTLGKPEGSVADMFGTSGE